MEINRLGASTKLLIIPRENLLARGLTDKTKGIGGGMLQNLVPSLNLFCSPKPIGLPGSLRLETIKSARNDYGQYYAITH